MRSAFLLIMAVIAIGLGATVEASIFLTGSVICIDWVHRVRVTNFSGAPPEALAGRKRTTTEILRSPQARR